MADYSGVPTGGRVIYISLGNKIIECSKVLMDNQLFRFESGT